MPNEVDKNLRKGESRGEKRMACRRVPWQLSVLAPVMAIFGLPMPAWGKPDLTAQVEVVSMKMLSCTQMEVTLKATLTNIGDSACKGAWYADFWPDYNCSCDVHPLECNDPGTVPYKSGKDEVLDPGEAVVLTQQVVLSPSPSSYNALVFVDSVLDICKESDETNNIGCVTFDVSPSQFEADLILTDCNLTKDPEFGANVFFTATIENHGCTATKNKVYVDLFMSPEASPDCQDYFLPGGDVFVEAPAGIPPSGGVQVVSGVYKNCQPGPYNPVCVVNSDMQQPEVDYSNNCFWPDTYVCPEIIDRPDLVLSEFEVVLSPQGVPVFKGVVKNDGVVPVEPGEFFKLCIWPNKVNQPGLGEVPDVKAGEGYILDFPDDFPQLEEDWLPAGKGVAFAKGGMFMQNGCYKAWARVDCDSDLLEVNEKNNDAMFDWCVDLPGPDCYIEDLVAKTVDDETKFSVAYTVLVANQGEDPCPAPLDLDVFANCPVPPFPGSECSGSGVHKLIEHSLEPGAKQSFELVWAPEGGVPSGTYTSWAVLDFFGAYHDTNLENNHKSVTFDVPEYVPGLPNISVEEFSCRTFGNQITYSIKVTNKGEKKATTPFRIDLFTDRDAPPIWGELGDQNVTLESLEAGAWESWDALWEGVADGEYKAFVLVDTQQVLKESNKGDNLAGPRICVVCSTCAACEEGVYLSGPCLCGEETVQYGFCCNGEWYAVGCPNEFESEEDATLYPEGSSAVEMGNIFGPAKPNCGCNVEQSVRVGAGVWVLVVLSGLLLGLGRIASLPRAGLG